MHRETLSRSLYFSHNLLGKSIILGCSQRMVIAARPATTIKNHHDPSAKSYHKSFARSTQSVTNTVVAETRKTVESPSSLSVQEKNQTPRKRQLKHFNISAKEILNSDEIASPKKPEAIDASSIANRTLLESQIFSVHTEVELLNMAQEPDLTLKHACFIIHQLGNFALLRPNSRIIKNIETDERFIKLFNLIQRGNHSQFPHTLLQALVGLQRLGLENKGEICKLLEHELSWSMRRCPLKFLSKSVRILNENTKVKLTEDTGDTPSVLTAAIHVLNRRWIEAITGGDFISLFQIIDLLEDETKLKVEERAADVAHQFKSSEIMKMFVVLGIKKRRPTPLLRALAFHYSKSENKSSAKDIVELIYAMNELSFADPVLMSRLCSDLSESIPQVKNVTLISSLMTSLGQMRYKTREILLAVDDWIMKNIDGLRVFDYAAWLQASATFNYQSINTELFCTKAKKVLTQSNVSSPHEWVNIVHSFAVLNHHNSEMLSSVLSSSFVDGIEKLGVRSTRQKVKLLNLNFIAKGQKLDKNIKYTGPLLDTSKVTEWTATLVCSSDDKLSKLVLDSMGSFLPVSKYLELNQQLECGVFVEAICNIDGKRTPIPLESSTTSKGSNEPIQKVAIVVEGYASMCVGVKDPTGHSILNRKLLEAQNYIVLTVPYTEFTHNEKLIRRVQYLEQKLKSMSQSTPSS